MHKTNQKRIADWLPRLALLSTLVPSILIAFGLLAAALFANHWLQQQSLQTLRANALQQLQGTAHDRTRLIGRRLAAIATDVQAFARHTGLALQRPSRSGLERYKSFARSAEGALYSSAESGGFAFFYSGITPVGPGEVEKLQRLLRVDPAMAGLLHRNPGAVEVFFTSHDSLNLSYPYRDPLSRFTPGTDITAQARYVAVEAAQPSQEKPVWLNPPEQSERGAWLAACLVPVWREDSLEGVAGMAIDLTATIAPLVGSGTSTAGQIVLLTADGTLVQTWSGTEPGSGRHFVRKASATVSAPSEPAVRPADFAAGDGVAAPAVLAAVLAVDTGTRIIDWNGEQLAAWATIPETGWKLLALMPSSQVIAGRTLPHATIGQAILGTGLGLALLLLVLFWLTRRRSRELAARLTRPLEQIATMARQTAEGKYLHQLPDDWSEEQRRAGEALQALGEKLQGDLQDQTRTRISLRRSGEALEQRLSKLSSELKLETRRRKRLEKAPALVAGYDAVTGLPNPRLFVDRAHQALALAKRHGETVTLVLIELYELKAGDHPEDLHALDALHREVAIRLQLSLRDCDTIARLSHDEFVILLFDHEAAGDPEKTARRIIERVGSAQEETDQGTAICGSIGISNYPEDGERVEELLHQADNDLVQRRESDRHCFRVGIPGTGE